MWTTLTPYIIAIVSAIGAALSIWFGAKKAGASQAKLDATAKAAAVRDKAAANAIAKSNAANDTATKAVENANTASHNANVADDPNAKLRNEWSRD
jgi:hypothetical protein